MKRYFLIGLFVFGTIVSANAQKLINGGTPKAAVSTKTSASHCVDLPKGISVCKYTENPADEDKEPFGEFRIRKNLKTVGTIPASPQGQTTSKDFKAFYGDLDKNSSAEIVIAEFGGQSNGMGISYYGISILPDFETKGLQPAIKFNTEEFGADGTFVYDAKTKETLILVTDFNGLDNLSQKEGTYFVGRFFRYQNGLLKPAADKPIYARRYTNSFEAERFRTENSSLRPWLWLNSPKAQKLKIDTEFSVKPLSSQTGVVEKFEKIKEESKTEDGETETVEYEQIIVKYNSGETKTIVLSKNPEYIERESDKQKIFPETFGMLPTNISLPKDVSPNLVLGNLEGKKVVINSYKPFEFDEDKKPRYKVLFYE